MITALLESWTINDDNYPEMSVGDTVNLAFGFAPEHIETTRDTVQQWQHVQDARYTFVGTVIQRYDEPEALIVVHAREMKFFVEGPLIQQCMEGDLVRGKGELIVDYYIWAEDLAERAAPPDIFYNLAINRIQRVDAASADRANLRRTDAGSHGDSIYLIEFSVTDAPVARTFRYQ